MAGISIVPFLGMTPRTAERLIEDGRSVDAQNLILTSGEIRPIRAPLLVNVPSVEGPWISVHRAENMGQETWLAWNRDVDVANAALPPEVEERYYWTGDGEPRYAPFSRLPNDFFALGIPKPQTAPTVTPMHGTGHDITRVYVYTFFSQFGEESGISPPSLLTTGKVDATWNISNMDAFPASAGTGTAVHSMGVTTFTNTGPHWLRPGDEIDFAGTIVAVLATPTFNTFTVSGDFSAQTAWSRVAPWNTFGMKRRLYRSAGTSGNFQLVDDDVGTTYADTLTDLQILGDELISAGYEVPPTGMKGLLSLPNGAMVAFLGNQVLYSEPFQPHAWPLEYRRNVDFEIVGIGAYGTTVVACTSGKPYICAGNDPSSVTAESTNNVWPCLSKRGVVSVSDGVLFPTSYGMAYIGLRGNEIFTNSLFTRFEWTPRNPDTMVAAAAEGRVFVRYLSDAGQRGVMVFDLENPGIGLTELSFYPDEIYSDPRNGLFYLVDNMGIKQYDQAEGARVQYSWKSKEYHFGKPVNFGAAKLDFFSEMTPEDVAAEEARYQAELDANQLLIDNYRGFGGVNGAPLNTYKLNGSNIQPVTPPQVERVTFTLYSKNIPVYSMQLAASQNAFKLPAGFKSDSWSVGITGTLRIKAVKIAETMQGLREL